VNVKSLRSGNGGIATPTSNKTCTLYVIMTSLQAFDCQHFYVDMGTNMGVQIRKLYEPAKYPGAKVLPIFDKHFGTPERSART